ncbi:MAG: crotonase/enoyl-CoA hydratase family protein [Anaerolineales bacterium]
MKQNSASDEGRITCQVKGHLFIIGIDRPAKRNAFSWEMINDLSSAYTEYQNDENLRCAVLFAHGDHFTAGLDLASVAPQIAQGQLRFPEGIIDPWGVHGEALSKPLICAVQGWCLTLGIELMLAADIVIAAADSRFAQIEVQRGIFPFGGATIRMVASAGWGNAMRYLLTGDEFGAQEALRIGLIQEVVSPGDQLTRAVEIAERISAQAPLAVQATLASARSAVLEGFHSASAGLLPTILDLMKTEDAQEGLMSFLERRKAQFKGR